MDNTNTKQSWLDRTIDSNPDNKTVRLSDEVMRKEHTAMHKLTDGHITFIKHRIANSNIQNHTNIDPYDVISSINKVFETPTESLFDDLCAQISTFVPGICRSLAKQILVYKKKPCRNGRKCIDMNTCIFLHEGNEDTSKREGVKVNGEGKRIKVGNCMQLVVLNHVPFETNVSDVITHIEGFGPINFYRRLGPNKFIFEFTNPEDAHSFVTTSDHVCGVPEITKFFHNNALEPAFRGFTISRDVEDCRELISILKDTRYENLIEAVNNKLNIIEQKFDELHAREVKMRNIVKGQEFNSH